MRALSDKWNPRLWLRDWLAKPSKNELLQAARTQAGMRAAIKAWHASENEKDAKRRSDAERQLADRRPPAEEESTRCGSPAR